jgi:hypothetical protein
MTTSKNAKSKHIIKLNSEFNLFLADDESSKRAKMKQLNKTLRSLKHKMDDLEANFEIKHGYKPSQVRHFLRLMK